MRAKRVILIATAILVVGVIAVAASQLLGTEREQEKAITLEQLPAAVKAMVLKQAGEHSILELEEVRLGEKIYYEAEWMEGGLEVEIQIAPDGTLLGRSMEEPDDEDDDGEEDKDKDNDAEKDEDD